MRNLSPSVAWRMPPPSQNHHTVQSHQSKLWDLLVEPCTSTLPCTLQCKKSHERAKRCTVKTMAPPSVWRCSVLIVMGWMSIKKLKRNPDKTEIVFCLFRKESYSPRNLRCSLGVFWDPLFWVQLSVSLVAKSNSAFNYFKLVCQLHPFLGMENVTIVTHALIAFWPTCNLTKRVRFSTQGKKQ